MCLQLANVFHVKIALIKELFFKKGLFTAYESGSINTEELLKLTCKKMDNQVKQEVFVQALLNIFSLNKGVFSLVKELKFCGYRLIAFSNTNEVHYGFIKKTYAMLMKLFDEKILSFKIGAIKPELTIYQHGIKLAACLPSECFYIDDIQQNLIPEKKMGLHTHHFENVNLLKLELQKNKII